MSTFERTVKLVTRLGLILLSVATCVALGAVVFRVGMGPLAEALRWFDPLFLQYNLALALLAILIVPVVTVQYVHNMKTEKIRRIERDLSAKELELYRREIEHLVPLQFRLGHYWGSLTVVMAVITLGVSILLLFKPYFPLPAGEQAAAPPAASQAERSQGGSEPAVSPSGPRTSDPVSLGVDYGRGGNMLLLGPFVELYSTDRPRYYHQIVISLTAFQFGFLGAYVYFIGYLLRAYFTLDLSPHTYVAGSLRMVVSSVLALVLSFALPALDVFGAVSQAAYSERFLRLLPLLAFFLGYFPNRALFLLEKTSNQLLGLGPQAYAGTPLSRLAGMSSDHEVRLDREGFDNLENLSHARPIDLAVRTGFSYRQLRQWVEEARLRVQLAEDFEEFADRTGIRTAEELVTYWQVDPDVATKHLQEIVSPKIFGKLTVVIPLLRRKQADRISTLLAEPIPA
jgi:hypothetical protein